jgi:hypothetical protein
MFGLFLTVSAKVSRELMAGGFVPDALKKSFPLGSGQFGASQRSNLLGPDSFRGGLTARMSQLCSMKST